MPEARTAVAVVHTDPDPIIKALEKRGFAGIACPSLTIASLSAPVDPSLYDAAIATSAHAIPAILKSGLPVYAVGPQTEEAARLAGIKVLATGRGGVAELASLPQLKNKKLAHICGTHVAPGTREAMLALGAVDICTYTAVPVNALTPGLVQALEGQSLYAVMGFSVRGMHGFTDCVKQGTNLRLWRGVRGVALSMRIASAMDGVPYTDIKVAAHPNRNAILEALVS